MRITQRTPSYDSLQPYWSEMFNYEDGTFASYGSRRLHISDTRIIVVLVLEIRPSLVSISSRALAPRTSHPDFLSIRIGALTARPIPLSLEITTFIHIDHLGQLHLHRRPLSGKSFCDLWRSAAPIPGNTASKLARALLPKPPNSHQSL